MTDTELRKQFSKIDEKFAKLFVYMEKRFAVLEAKIDTKADAGQTYKALDTIIKRLEVRDQERVFMDYQLSHHEGWIGQLAEATQTKLTPER